MHVEHALAASALEMVVVLMAGTLEKFRHTGDASLIWEGRKAGRHFGYCHLEKLGNLAALPSTGFRIACFPVKVKGASAGWTRAVAILDE